MAGSRQHDGATAWPGDGTQWTRNLSDNWSQAMGAWMALAKGAPGVEDSMSRMADPVHSFAQLLQSMNLSGDGNAFSAADISRRWREIFSQAQSSPLLQMMGKAGTALDPQALLAPVLEAFQREAGAALNQPSFGFAREHQARWQGLLKAQLEHQTAMSRYNDLIKHSSEQAFALFESKLAEHEAPGRQLTSVRAVFDLWIDAAEEAYAQTAMTPAFRDAYGEMVNAQMRLRAANQTELEQVCRSLGLPTRSEVTATHRKLHALEREVRGLRAQAASGRTQAVAPVPAATRSTAKVGAARSAKRPAAKASTTKPSVAKATAARANKQVGKARSPAAASVASARQTKAVTSSRTTAKSRASSKRPAASAARKPAARRGKES